MGKPTTKNQVIDYLQWSSEDYEWRLLLSMLKWCQKYGAYPSVTQQLLANVQVNKWFMREYEKLELQFIEIAEKIPNKTRQLEGHYKACTSEIQEIYPKPLIEGIKRNRDFSNELTPNTPIYYAN